ncbi:hypothetical protein GCM10022403_089870 [Streptomyces coacervatus]|uniref:Uncharacterized protein n=1 Tax=Streptomyces coacervatus TaxID=647381 RepID=A0ABP7JH17_9ACTN|nr:hypothetical protein [Streptomyces coacervatus]MDF2271171.1 hypothetical protein [Streptomyces coacervatus]
MRKLQQAMIAAAVAAGSLSAIGAGTGTAYADGHGHGHSHGHGKSHSASPHGHSHTATHRSVSTTVERIAPKAAAPHRAAHQEHGHVYGTAPKATEHYRPYQECSPQTVADGDLPIGVLGLSETFDTTCGQFNNAFTA